MLSQKYIFAGNRFCVLEKMLELGLQVVKIFALRDSFLAKELQRRNIIYEVIPPKHEFVQILNNLEFNVFVSNGCPVILPITELTSRNSKIFINVHPSFLPDLRGRDPVPGALLYGRTSGATCYVMDDKIDTGAIIAQIPIDFTDDLDCGLLYQLSFVAEQQVFFQAFLNNFKPSHTQFSTDKDIYYTIKDIDLKINFMDDAKLICRQIKAFNSRSRGAFFIFRGERYVVRDCEIVTNKFAVGQFSGAVENQVVLNYEQRLLLKKGNELLKLKQILCNDVNLINVGDVLGY